MTGSFGQYSWIRVHPACSAVAILAVLLLIPRVFAQPARYAPEESIKAAYLYNFAAYIDWPDGMLGNANTRLAVGIFGDDSLADELSRITAGRLVQGRGVEVRRVGAAETLDGLHILFIAAAESAALAQLVPEARPKSILLVTEFDDALASGSVINFRLIDQHVRFEVSLEAAHQSHLAISSRLLAVAEHVRPRSGG